MNNAYMLGFYKVAEEYNIDPAELLKFAKAEKLVNLTREVAKEVIGPAGQGLGNYGTIGKMLARNGVASPEFVKTLTRDRINNAWQRLQKRIARTHNPGTALSVLGKSTNPAEFYDPKTLEKVTKTMGTLRKGTEKTLKKVRKIAKRRGVDTNLPVLNETYGKSPLAINIGNGNAIDMSYPNKVIMA